MAINVKGIITEGLLKLCEEIPLEIITIKQLLVVTGVSRQTFYNHFFDKNDLIQYIYLKKIIPGFDDTSIEINFRNELLEVFQTMKKYHVFMKQACMMQGQNCLNDFIFEHCRSFDLEWHQKRYGKEEMPEALRFATEYHSTASSSMTLSWILSDMPASCEEMADLIAELRRVGMKKLFDNSEIKDNPYKSN